MRTSEGAELVAFYAHSWINGDTRAVRRVIAGDAEIEWNLRVPVDDEELVRTLDRISAFADSVTIVATTYAGDRACLIYDCAAPFGTVRFAEFVTVADGAISELRQVYDRVALRRFFPGLLDD
jgi:ketosteroid isomerase-like protein